MIFQTLTKTRFRKQRIYKGFNKLAILTPYFLSKKSFIIEGFVARSAILCQRVSFRSFTDEKPTQLYCLTLNPQGSKVGSTFPPIMKNPGSVDKYLLIILSEAFKEKHM